MNMGELYRKCQLHILLVCNSQSPTMLYTMKAMYAQG